MIKSNADAFFSIGKTHSVCQDYAIAGYRGDGTAYAAVCDGCSNSPHTDSGARLLAAAVASRPTSSFDTYHALMEAAAAAGCVQLPLACLDATLVLASWEAGEQPDVSPCVWVKMWGDGAVAARKRNGEFVLHLVEHLKGAPPYLSYQLDPVRHAAYRREFGDEVQVTTHTWRLENDHPCSVSSATRMDVGPSCWRFDSRNVDLVVVMSDGVQSFQRTFTTATSKTVVDVSAIEVAAQVLGVAGVAGDFMQRRCKALLRRLTAQGWQHNDDFSAAAIYMGAP